MKVYSGIGSRKTPDNVLELMTSLAIKLRWDGWKLLSGGARGADTAFEGGAHGISRIYRPEGATKEAIELASQFHPAWDRCNEYTRKLHGRNAQILLGSTLRNPVKFVVCWAPVDSENLEKGGTGLGCRIARAHNIPVFNLFFPEVRERLERYSSNE